MPERWTLDDAEDLYGPLRWGDGYYGIDDQGRVAVTPKGKRGPKAALTDIISQLAERDIHPPFSVRFPQVLEDRIRRLHESYLASMDEYGYGAGLRLVYPMKVNQRKETVLDLLECGAPWHYGLEVGSKPELLSALAMDMPSDSLLIANGFKDREFVELAASGVELGHNVIIVLDKVDEAQLVADTVRDLPHKPHIGIRVKLHAKGGGKWVESGGERAKFGLNVPELLHAIDVLRAEGLEDRLKMVHFHIGSQITDIKRIHQGVLEAARVYAKLRKMGLSVDTIDVGGGLGVDYDGSGTASSASMNYDLREYTNTLVYTIKTVTDEEGVPHPTIVSESGRAVVAYQSVLVLELLKRVPEDLPDRSAPAEGDHRIVHDMASTLKGVSLKNYPEAYHDALALRDEANQRFNFGILSLEERAKVENLFRAIAARVLRCADRDDNMLDEFLDLKKLLQHKFIANYSLFQSTPDIWGVKQLFPIMPLHRLREEPKEFGTIVDITCDSDGEIRKFIDVVDVKDTLELHALKDDQPYHIGIFLTGAYQDTLGDFHNLFGRVHEAYVELEDDGTATIKKIVEGDTVEEVLWLVNWEHGELFEQMTETLAKKVKAGRLDAARAKEVRSGFKEALAGYTYLEK